MIAMTERLGHFISDAGLCRECLGVRIIEIVAQMMYYTALAISVALLDYEVTLKAEGDVIGGEVRGQMVWRG